MVNRVVSHGFSRGLLFALAAVLLPASTASAAEDDAEILSVKGGVFVREASKTLLRPVAAGVRLHAGDAVVTGTEGWARVRIDKQEVSVAPTTELVVQKQQQKRGLVAALRALFGSKEEGALSAGGGIRSGGRALKILAPLGPIVDTSPEVKWESSGIRRFRVEVVDTRGFELERKVNESKLSLSQLRIKLAPGRYYLTVESIDGQGQPLRATVPFDVAEGAVAASTPAPR